MCLAARRYGHLWSPPPPFRIERPKVRLMEVEGSNVWQPCNAAVKQGGGAPPTAWPELYKRATCR